MRLKRHGLPMQLLSKVIQPLWNSRIHDLEALQHSDSESILVALDTESSCQNVQGHVKPCQGVSEVGIAILRFKGKITRSYEGVKQLHYEGGAEAITIQVRERRLQPKEQFIGQVIRSEPRDVSSILEDILSKHKGPRILVGYDLLHEFKWMIEECPNIPSYFASWLDVQDFAQQRCEKFAREPSKGRPLGLSTVLKAMNIHDQRFNFKTHYAVNDALRSLIVLCSLVSDASLLSNLDPQPAARKSVRCFSLLKFKYTELKHPFMARIKPTDGGKLPGWSPLTVSKYFATYTELKAVGLNWRTEKDKSDGVRFWQLSFGTAESLDEFINEIDASTIDGIRISVAKFNFQRDS